MCKFCENFENILTENTDVADIYINGNILRINNLCSDDYYSWDEEVKINYCPMCGNAL